MKLGWLVMAPSERSCGGKSAAIMTRARTFAVSMSRSQRTSVCKARCFFAIHGFEVTPAATVAEALAEITSQQFDVLIADLNIGQPGDGFTVVSAMRRTQPDCVTFILTGYPALETALQAIRSQVDDYAIKPADIPELVATIKERLKNRTRNRVLPTKRLSNILRDHVSEIVERTLEQMKSYSKMGALALPGENGQMRFLR